MKAKTHQRRGAFTLIELLLVVAIIALLISILLPALAGARKAARHVICQANMRMFNTGFQNYTGDAKGLIASFSWQPNKPTPSEYLDNRITPSSATMAHARQAIEYIRKIAQEPTLIQPASDADGRMLARNFTQLVLMYGGYYGDRNPEPAAACSEDRDLLQWQKLTPTQARIQLGAWDGGAPAAFAPYYSSYQIIPNAFQDEKGPGQISAATNDYRLYGTPGSARFTQRRLDAVSFPSQKVVWFDLFDRHTYKRPIYFGYPIAKQPLAFFDGSVRVCATKDANVGWKHTDQGPQAGPTMMRYINLNQTDPLPLYTSIAANTNPERYRWTRMGIRGVDFGGKEVTK